MRLDNDARLMWHDLQVNVIRMCLANHWITSTAILRTPDVCPIVTTIPIMAWNTKSRKIRIRMLEMIVGTGDLALLVCAHWTKCPFDSSSITAMAARHGQLAILQWLYHTAGCPLDIKTCMKEAKAQHERVVIKWLMQLQNHGSLECYHQTKHYGTMINPQEKGGYRRLVNVGTGWTPDPTDSSPSPSQPLLPFRRPRNKRHKKPQNKPPWWLSESANKRWELAKDYVL